MLEAYLYARRSRVSSDRVQITDQVDHGRANCEASGWHLAESAILSEEISASRYARRQREAWPLLLEALEAGKVGVLVLWESSRGDRKLSEWARLLDLCRDHGTLIHVISHERTYDLRNHRDWKTLASEGVDNDHYTQRLSADIKRGKRGAIKRGRPQGAPPYGYRVRYDQRTGKPAGWDVIDEHAEAVRRIVSAVGRHVPKRQVARDLNAAGVPSATGGTWRPEAVGIIAGNPSYAGLIRLPDGTLAERDPAYPPIVERHEWEAADAVLRPRKTGERPGAVRHMLSYIISCECGARLEADGEGRYRCTGGHSRVDEEWLDEVVGYLVCAKLARDDARDLYADNSDARAGELKQELDELLARRRRFRARAGTGEIDDDALVDIEAEMNPKIRHLEHELGEVRYVPALRDILTAGDTFAAWAGYTVQARREVITAVTGITVLRVPRPATNAQRLDPARVVPDWKPQPLRPPNRQGLRLTRNA